MKLDKLLPEVYYRESRDFSYIGRVLEVAFNYMKTASDTAKLNLNENMSATLVDLWVTTVGFELKHEYIDKDLIALCQSFKSILRNKGTEQSIIEAITLLLNTQGIKNKVNVMYDTSDSANILIYVSSQLKDLALLEDVFEYILPVGTTYRFINADNSDTYTYDNKINHNDNVKMKKIFGSYTSEVSGDGVDENNNYIGNTDITRDIDNITHLSTIGTTIISGRDGYVESEE